MYTKGDLELINGEISLWDTHLGIIIGGVPEARAIILDLQEKIKQLEEKMQ